MSDEKKKPAAFLKAVVRVKNHKGEVTEQWVDLCPLWKNKRGDLGGRAYALPMAAYHDRELKLYISVPNRPTDGPGDFSPPDDDDIPF